MSGPGRPVAVHWGVPDPAAVPGATERIEKAFREVFVILDHRTRPLVSLPTAGVDKFGT